MALPQLTPTAPIVVDSAANFVLQVDSAGGTVLGTGSWVTVFGIDSFVPSKTDNLQSIDNFDTRGWESKQKFLSGWSNAVGLLRGKYAGAYDVGQELIRATNEAGGLLHCRWFDINGSLEAYEGFGFPTWEAQSGGPNDPRKVNSTITGNGARTLISNPVATNSAPIVSSASPSGLAAGALLRVGGSLFTGITAVTVGGVTVTSGNRDTVSDALIELIMPAGSAGSAPIVVTNATGASNSFPYTRA